MPERSAPLSTEQLKERMENEGVTLLDIRPMAAYNGWRLEGEERGGHLPGARSIPLRWTRYMDWVEVLEEKNIRPGDEVVVYGYGSEQSRSMAAKLEKLGYEKVRRYDSFLSDWSADPERPLERLPKYRRLVPPDFVRRLIDGEEPDGLRRSDCVICHSHYGYPEDYQRGHIPGAVAVDTNVLESTDTWNRRNPRELDAALRGLGITRDTTVILYGRFSSPVYDEEKFPGKSAGHLGAMRCAALMLYAGVEDVRILNGGITSWENRGYELSTEPHEPKPADDFGGAVPLRPELMVDTPLARELLASDEGELVSVRSWKEFTGRRSGYHYIDKKGRIPGAIFGNCGSDAYHMENYRNFDHTMREYGEVAAAWRQEGITPEKHIAFYCGTGWRGSEAFMHAWLMDWPRISVYDGGWYEWSADPDNPIATGEPDTIPAE